MENFRICPESFWRILQKLSRFLWRAESKEALQKFPESENVWLIVSGLDLEAIFFKKSLNANAIFFRTKVCPASGFHPNQHHQASILLHFFMKIITQYFFVSIFISWTSWQISLKFFVSPLKLKVFLKTKLSFCQKRLQSYFN